MHSPPSGPTLGIDENHYMPASHPAARQAQTTEDSLNAQVRSWKAKAEAAERRAADERDKRRRLEAGAKGALAQARKESVGWEGCPLGTGNGRKSGLEREPWSSQKPLGCC